MYNLPNIWLQSLKYSGKKISLYYQNGIIKDSLSTLELGYDREEGTNKINSNSVSLTITKSLWDMAYKWITQDSKDYICLMIENWFGGIIDMQSVKINMLNNTVDITANGWMAYADTISILSELYDDPIRNGEQGELRGYPKVHFFPNLNDLTIGSTFQESGRKIKIYPEDIYKTQKPTEIEGEFEIKEVGYDYDKYRKTYILKDLPEPKGFEFFAAIINKWRGTKKAKYEYAAIEGASNIASTDIDTWNDLLDDNKGMFCAKIDSKRYIDIRCQGSIGAMADLPAILEAGRSKEGYTIGDYCTITWLDEDDRLDNPSEHTNFFRIETKTKGSLGHITALWWRGANDTSNLATLMGLQSNQNPLFYAAEEDSESLEVTLQVEKDSNPLGEFTKLDYGSKIKMFQRTSYSSNQTALQELFEFTIKEIDNFETYQIIHFEEPEAIIKGTYQSLIEVFCIAYTYKKIVRFRLYERWKKNLQIDQAINKCLTQLEIAEEGQNIDLQLPNNYELNLITDDNNLGQEAYYPVTSSYYHNGLRKQFVWIGQDTRLQLYIENEGFIYPQAGYNMFYGFEYAHSYDRWTYTYSREKYKIKHICQKIDNELWISLQSDYKSYAKQDTKQTKLYLESSEGITTNIIYWISLGVVEKGKTAVFSTNVNGTDYIDIGISAYEIATCRSFANLIILIQEALDNKGCPLTCSLKGSRLRFTYSGNDPEKAFIRKFWFTGHYNTVDISGSTGDSARYGENSENKTYFLASSKSQEDCHVVKEYAYQDQDYNFSETSKTILARMDITDLSNPKVTWLGFEHEYNNDTEEDQRYKYAFESHSLYKDSDNVYWLIGAFADKGYGLYIKCINLNNIGDYLFYRLTNSIDTMDLRPIISCVDQTLGKYILAFSNYAIFVVDIASTIVKTINSDADIDYISRNEGTGTTFLSIACAENEGYVSIWKKGGGKFEYFVYNYLTNTYKYLDVSNINPVGAICYSPYKAGTTTTYKRFYGFHKDITTKEISLISWSLDCKKDTKMLEIENGKTWYYPCLNWSKTSEYKFYTLVLKGSEYDEDSNSMNLIHIDKYNYLLARPNFTGKTLSEVIKILLEMTNCFLWINYDRSECYFYSKFKYIKQIAINKNYVASEYDYYPYKEEKTNVIDFGNYQYPSANPYESENLIIKSVAGDYVDNHYLAEELGKNWLEWLNSYNKELSFDYLFSDLIKIGNMFVWEAFKFRIMSLTIDFLNQIMNIKAESYKEKEETSNV